MKTEGYLNINRNGSIRFTKSLTGLKWDEIRVKINIDVPDTLFERPVLQANLKVTEEAVEPQEITEEILINTKELIEQQTYPVKA